MNDIFLIFISLNLNAKKQSQKLCFVNFKNEIAKIIFLRITHESLYKGGIFRICEYKEERVEHGEYKNPNSGGTCRLFHIPMFDKVLQIELTIPTSLGWEFSNLFTEVESPSKDNLKSCGFFFSRIAS
jgi:hypothetical protein